VWSASSGRPCRRERHRLVRYRKPLNCVHVLNLVQNILAVPSYSVESSKGADDTAACASIAPVLINAASLDALSRWARRARSHTSICRATPLSDWLHAAQNLCTRTMCMNVGVEYRLRRGRWLLRRERVTKNINTGIRNRLDSAQAYRKQRPRHTRPACTPRPEAEVMNILVHVLHHNQNGTCMHHTSRQESHRAAGCRRHNHS
jgi:hypothetical protein